MTKISIIWVDSDPNIYYKIDRFRSENLHVACFNETNDAIKTLEDRLLEPGHIDCIITSLMERDGRRERGLLNGLDMLDRMKIMWKEAGIEQLPLMVVISQSADVEECKQRGVDLVVFGSLMKLQEEVIEHLKQRQNSRKMSRVILIGIAGPSGCGKSTYAEHLAVKLQSPFQPVNLDYFFHKPIIVNHPSLGRIKSLEQPETINHQAFIKLLRQIKLNWIDAEWPRNSFTAQEQSTVYVVVEGFLLFALSDEVTSMLDIRLFLDSSQSRCRMQRFRRSRKIHRQIPDSQVEIDNKFAQWFDQMVWAEYLQRRDEQKSRAEKIFQEEDYENRNYAKLDAYMDERLKAFV